MNIAVTGSGTRAWWLQIQYCQAGIPASYTTAVAIASDTRSAADFSREFLAIASTERHIVAARQEYSLPGVYRPDFLDLVDVDNKTPVSPFEVPS